MVPQILNLINSTKELWQKNIKLRPIELNFFAHHHTCGYFRLGEIPLTRIFGHDFSNYFIGWIVDGASNLESHQQHQRTVTKKYKTTAHRVKFLCTSSYFCILRNRASNALEGCYSDSHINEVLTDMICPPRPCAASEHSMTALSCGYPTPAFFRVVHTDPGPIPTLIMSAPARINSSTISQVTTFPAFKHT